MAGQLANAKRQVMMDSASRKAIIIIALLQLAFIMSMLLLMIDVYGVDTGYSLILLSMLLSALSILAAMVATGIPVECTLLTPITASNYALVLTFFCAFAFGAELIGFAVRLFYVIPEDSPCDTYFSQCVALSVVNGLLMLAAVAQIIASLLYRQSWLVTVDDDLVAAQLAADTMQRIDYTTQEVDAYTLVDSILMTAEENPELRDRFSSMAAPSESTRDYDELESRVRQLEEEIDRLQSSSSTYSPPTLIGTVRDRTPTAGCRMRSGGAIEGESIEV